MKGQERGTPRCFFYFSISCFPKLVQLRGAHAVDKEFPKMCPPTVYD